MNSNTASGNRWIKPFGRAFACEQVFGQLHPFSSRPFSIPWNLHRHQSSPHSCNKLRSFDYSKYRKTMFEIRFDYLSLFMIRLSNFSRSTDFRADSPFPRPTSHLAKHGFASNFSRSPKKYPRWPNIFAHDAPHPQDGSHPLPNLKHEQERVLHEPLHLQWSSLSKFGSFSVIFPLIFFHFTARIFRDFNSEFFKKQIDSLTTR